MENSVRKREWVKTAAIIFLAVLLVLTFFSKTIMNASLPEVAAQQAASGAINARRVNLRSGPSTDYRSLGRLDEGTALYVLSQSGSWYRVRIKSSGKTGYIHRLYVTLSGIPDETKKEAGGAVNGSGVNLRSGPSTDYKSLGKLKKGTPLTILSLCGNWYQVRVNSTGETGYMYKKYVTVAP